MLARIMRSLNFLPPVACNRIFTMPLLFSAHVVP
jgi:hypothetical protein